MFLLYLLHAYVHDYLLLNEVMLNALSGQFGFYVEESSNVIISTQQTINGVYTIRLRGSRFERLRARRILAMRIPIRTIPRSYSKPPLSTPKEYRTHSHGHRTREGRSERHRRKSIASKVAGQVLFSLRKMGRRFAAA